MGDLAREADGWRDGRVSGPLGLRLTISTKRFPAISTRQAGNLNTRARYAS